MLSNSSLKTLVSSFSKFAITYPGLSAILSLVAYNSWNTLFSWIFPRDSRFKITNPLDDSDQDPSGPHSLRISIKNSKKSQDPLSYPSSEGSDSRWQTDSQAFSRKDQGVSVRGTPRRSSPVGVDRSTPTSSPRSPRSPLSKAFENIFEKIFESSQTLGRIHNPPGLAPSPRGAQELCALRVLFNNLEKLQSQSRSQGSPLTSTVGTPALLSSTQAHFFYFSLIAPEEQARLIAASMLPDMIVIAQYFESQGFSQWSSQALRRYPEYALLVQAPYTREITEASRHFESEGDLRDLYTMQTEIAHRSVQTSQKAFAPLFYLIPSLTQVFETQCWSALQADLDVLARCLENPTYTLGNTAEHYRSALVALKRSSLQVEAGASFSQSHPIQLLEALRTIRQLQCTLKAHYYALDSYKKHTYSQILDDIRSSSCMPVAVASVKRAPVLPPVSTLAVYMRSSQVLPGSDLRGGYKSCSASYTLSFSRGSDVNTCRYMLSIQPHPGKDSYFLSITAQNGSRKKAQGFVESYIYEVSKEALRDIWKSIQGSSSPLCLSELDKNKLTRSPSRDSVADPLSPTTLIKRITQ